MRALGTEPHEERPGKGEPVNAGTGHDIETLRSWILDTPPGGMVFFGGAGVSTESGIPDFRSADGIYAQGGVIPPEQMVSRSFFDAHPREFFDFYFRSMVFPDAQPNQAHRKLAELEREGILSAVITQNVDGLHQKIGSRNVFELHGSALRNYCTRCGAVYTAEELASAHERAGDGIPRCACGGIVRPDVVLYEEPLDQDVLRGAVETIQRADLLLIAGTSLVVYPAAGLIDYFRGSRLAIVNRDPTPRDRQADLCIAASIGEVMDF